MTAESIRGNETEKVRFTRKSDIQVAGMISICILTKGEHPFGSELVFVKNVIEGRPVY